MFPAFFPVFLVKNHHFSWQKTTKFGPVKSPSLVPSGPGPVPGCLRGGLPELQQHAARGGRRAEALEVLGAQVLLARSEMGFWWWIVVN